MHCCDRHYDGAPESIDMDPEPTSRESSPVREVLGGLLGAAIAMACVLPPLIHLITGPLGPLIGGFFAANMVKPGQRGRAVIAVTIGCGFVGAIVGAIAIIKSFTSEGLPSWFPSGDLLGAILVGVFAYGAGLGFAGTALSGAMAEKKAEKKAG